MADSQGDPFLRQRGVPDWDCDSLQNHSALLLGIGGVGCTIALDLCRLGIKRLHLVDMDVVDVTNLNRQVLYSASDVGRKKTDAAMTNLRVHNLKTEVVTHDIDAVLEWNKIVSLARQSTVVFNGIDHGEYFDYAVTSLCIRLGCHYVTGSSYGHTAIAENFPVPKKAAGTGPCWACNNSPVGRDVLEKLRPDLILTYKDLQFIPKDTHMPGSQSFGSSVVVASLAAHQAVTAWVNSLSGCDMPNWATFNLRTFEMFSYKVEQNPDCLLCTNKQPPFLDPTSLAIFFGRPSVHLREVGGSVLDYTPGCLTEEQNKELVASAHDRLNPLIHLGSDYKNVYIPCPPSTDVVGKLTQQSDGQAVAILIKPLLKAPEGSLVAIPSGIRSAILISNSDQTCYRLKGCGCYRNSGEVSSPFPIESMESKTDGVEIKGCCFKHTVERELFMTDKVSKLLAPHNLKTGNESVGAFLYDLEEEPFSRIPKYCGLYRTIGEKRLASDLLSGLEHLLPSFVPKLELGKILSLFPKRRIQDEKVQPTWSACCTSSDTFPPLDMRCHSFLDEALPDEPPEGVNALAWKEFSEDLKKVHPLSDDLKMKYGSCLAQLYWRLGQETGFFKRLLEDNDISWGYFFDHNPYEPHCNSHPNNFVVIPESLEGGAGQLLAPVDFDLAFTRSSFFSLYTGTPDDELFDSWISSEHKEMERGLGGEMANSGLLMSDVSLPCQYEALKWALRDTLLLGYRSAYGKLPDSRKGVPDCLKKAVRSLVNLALSFEEK